MPIVFMGDVSRDMAEFGENPSLQQRFKQTGRQINRLTSRISNQFRGTNQRKKKRSLSDNLLGTTTAGNVARAVGAGVGLIAAAKMMKNGKTTNITKPNPVPIANKRAAANLKVPALPSAGKSSASGMQRSRPIFSRRTGIKQEIIPSQPQLKPIPSGTGFGKTSNKKTRSGGKARKLKAGELQKSQKQSFPKIPDPWG